MKLLIAAWAFALAFVAVPACAQSGPVEGLCANGDAFAMSDDSSGIWSPCAVRPGKLIAGATYLQNASAVGGTALAAYPLLTLRTGIAKNVELLVRTPSQIAESGLNGAGLYPTSRPGFGVRYTTVQTDRFGLAVLAEDTPPVSRFSPTHAQDKYTVGLTAEYAMNPKLAFGLSTTATSSSKVGFDRMLPSVAFKAGFTLTPSTQVSTDLGTHLVLVHHGAQHYGDLWVDQSLHKNLTFNVGLGTTFNAVGDAKAHYLASGFNYRI